MLPTLLRTACVVMCALSLLAVQPTGLAEPNPQVPGNAKKPPPPPLTKPPRPPAPKPTTVKPRPTTVRPGDPAGHATHATHTRSAKRNVLQPVTLAGTTPKPQTWQRHHLHHRMAYEVRFRSRHWHSRVFVSYLAARTFMVYLHSYHFQRYLVHPDELTWVVNFRNPYWRHFGIYSSLPVAKRVEIALWQRGFMARMVLHPYYF